MLTLLQSFQGQLKAAASAAAAALGAFLMPLSGVAAACTLMVALDWLSAMALGRRLRRAGIAADGRLSSRRFGRLIVTLAKIYAAIVVAALVQEAVIGPEADFNAVKAIASAVCFWQLMSILENESTCSEARWAKTARRFLADKAKRHLGQD